MHRRSGNPVRRAGLAAWIAAGLGLFVAAPAEAACIVDPFVYKLIDNQEFTVEQVMDRDGCGRAFGRTGLMRDFDTQRDDFTQVEIESVSVLKLPTNLRISQSGKGLGFYVQPRPGFRGKDSYSIKACGTEGAQKGCVTVHFNVTAQ